MIYTLVKNLFKILFTIFLRLKVEGRENIPKDGPLVIASNHLSLLDPPVLGTAATRKVHFMAKEELFVPVLGTIYKILGAFPVRRGGADRAAIKHGIDILESGQVLAIFPEGTRNKTEDLMLPFKEGSFKMAEKTGCLIVPMAISGSADILEAHFPKVKPVHVIVEYGKPIDPKSLDKDTRKKLGSHCQGVIAEMLEKNNPQI